MVMLLLLAASLLASTAAVVLVLIKLAALLLLLEHSTTVSATVPARVVELCTKLVTEDTEAPENFLLSMSGMPKKDDVFRFLLEDTLRDGGIGVDAFTTSRKFR